MHAVLSPPLKQPPLSPFQRSVGWRSSASLRPPSLSGFRPLTVALNRIRPPPLESVCPAAKAPMGFESAADLARLEDLDISRPSRFWNSVHAAASPSPRSLIQDAVRSSVLFSTQFQLRPIVSSCWIRPSRVTCRADPIRAGDRAEPNQAACRAKLSQAILPISSEPSCSSLPSPAKPSHKLLLNGASTVPWDPGSCGELKGDDGCVKMQNILVLMDTSSSGENKGANPFLPAED